jgi:uncharacterized protein (TIGR02569 family)
VRGGAQRLAGGQGGAFLVDDIVMKPVDDPAETRWTCDLLTRVRSDGFRISEPVSTTDGQWVHRGWTATRFIPGLRSLAPQWGDVIEAGVRFCDAAEHARRDDDGVLAARTHRWAIADRVVWGEQTLKLHDDAAELFGDIAAEFVDGVYPRHFVHGDLSGNVFVDEHGTPVILDVSPYLRPRRWATAIVVCDALLWHNAGPDLADTFAAQSDRGLLLRALAFRLLAEALASDPTAEQSPFHEYRRVLAALR